MATPLEWALGLAIESLFKKLTGNISSKDLASKLEDEAKKWSNELPPDVHFHHEALFDKIIGDSELKGFPNLSKLRQELERNQIPNSELWCEALFERWKYVSSTLKPEEAQAFFKQTPEDAREQLVILAKRLEDTCKKDREFFQVSSYNRLTEIAQALSKRETILGPTADFHEAMIQIEQLSSSLSKRQKGSALEA